MYVTVNKRKHQHQFPSHFSLRQFKPIQKLWRHFHDQPVLGHFTTVLRQRVMAKQMNNSILIWREL